MLKNTSQVELQETPESMLEPLREFQTRVEQNPRRIFRHPSGQSQIQIQPGPPAQHRFRQFQARMTPAGVAIKAAGKFWEPSYPKPNPRNHLYSRDLLAALLCGFRALTRTEKAS